MARKSLLIIVIQVLHLVSDIAISGPGFERRF